MVRCLPETRCCGADVDVTRVGLVDGQVAHAPTDDGWSYVAAIMDLFARLIVCWSRSLTIKAAIVIDALNMALARRSPQTGLIHHSDRGVQYACGDYVARLEARGILISMSRIACPYDNAMAESFMKTLKTEEVEGRSYRDLAHARSDIGAFIEEVYNKHRLHSALAYRSPEEFEETIMTTGAAAQQPTGSPTTCP